MGFSSLAELLGQIRRSNPELDEGLHEREEMESFSKVLPPAAQKQVLLIRLRSGVLSVRVHHPVWKSELRNRWPQLLELHRAQWEESSRKTSTIRELRFVTSSV